MSRENSTTEFLLSISKRIGPVQIVINYSQLTRARETILDISLEYECRFRSNLTRDEKVLIGARCWTIAQRMLDV